MVKKGVDVNAKMKLKLGKKKGSSAVWYTGVVAVVGLVAVLGIQWYLSSNAPADQPVEAARPKAATRSSKARVPGRGMPAVTLRLELKTAPAHCCPAFPESPLSSDPRSELDPSVAGRGGLADYAAPSGREA